MATQGALRSSADNRLNKLAPLALPRMRHEEQDSVCVYPRFRKARAGSRVFALAGRPRPLFLAAITRATPAQRAPLPFQEEPAAAGYLLKPGAWAGL